MLYPHMILVVAVKYLSEYELHQWMLPPQFSSMMANSFVRPNVFHGLVSIDDHAISIILFRSEPFM